MSYLPNDKKTPKTPTEKVTFDDAWNGFKSDYLPFVEWIKTEEGFQMIIIKFTENNPTPYVNKWSREQFKMTCEQDESAKVLSAGKKLFIKLKAYCVIENALPVDLGLIQIDRFGSGFETDYRVSKATIQTKLSK